jgi:hypothetical protein
VPGAKLAFVELENFLMVLAANDTSLYTRHFSLSCEPLGAGSLAQLPVACTQRPQKILRKGGYPQVGLISYWAALDALDDPTTFDGQHFSEHLLGAFGGAAAQMAFAAFSAH